MIRGEASSLPAGTVERRLGRRTFFPRLDGLWDAFGCGARMPRTGTSNTIESMPGKGIDHSTCPKARVVRSLFSDAEKAFADVLMKAFHKGKVKVFIKVSVLDVIALDAAEPDKKRLFFWREVLGDKHFDYVVCRRETLEPLLAVELDDPTTPRRSSTADDVKATAARQAAFPVVRFAAGTPLTPDLVRAKLIAEYRVVRAGALPEEMG